MKISLLSPYLSSNGLGRAYVLAKMLERRYPVEVIGPVGAGGVWAPLKDEPLPCTGVPVRTGLGSLGMLRSLIRQARGDVLYASKPLLTSFGIGLVRKWAGGRPLVLDIDDWELGGFLDLPFGQRLRLALRPSAARLDTYYPAIHLLHRLVSQADARTVSSRFLQQHYGGVLIPHGRDTRRFDPARYNGGVEKERLGLEGRVVMFLGTPRPRKGLEDLLDAARLLGRADLQVAVVGAHPAADFTRELRSQGDPFLKLFGEQPFARIPAFLAAADIVVIPQRAADAFSLAQMPAKVYDAMALARPVIATAVSDLPEALSPDCGIIVPPGDPGELAQAIDRCLEQPQEAAEMGARARARCIKMYSWEAIEPALTAVFAPFE